MSKPENLILYSFPFTLGLRRMVCTEAAVVAVATAVVPPSVQGEMRAILRGQA